MDVDDFSPGRIFDLPRELPAPASEKEKALVLKLDQFTRTFIHRSAAGGGISPEDRALLLELADLACESAMAGTVLGFISLITGEFPAMRELYRSMIALHGELPPLLFYAAIADEKTGDLEAALIKLEKLMGSGLKNYWVYLSAARLFHRLGRFQQGLDAANLAVMENREHSMEPFAVLAQCYHSLGQLDRMVECFRRVEEVVGREGLENTFGPLYQAHRQLYGNIRSHILS
ncbi:MAG: hypothetical protein HQL31_01650 [Planctomycetes bacterium]|nr:hypothetical protein [Planctomycetota bacterium]